MWSCNEELEQFQTDYKLAQELQKEEGQSIHSKKILRNFVDEYAISHRLAIQLQEKEDFKEKTIKLASNPLSNRTIDRMSISSPNYVFLKFF